MDLTKDRPNIQIALTMKYGKIITFQMMCGLQKKKCLLNNVHRFFVIGCCTDISYYENFPIFHAHRKLFAVGLEMAVSRHRSIIKPQKYLLRPMQQLDSLCQRQIEHNLLLLRKMPFKSQMQARILFLFLFDKLIILQS